VERRVSFSPGEQCHCGIDEYKSSEARRHLNWLLGESATSSFAKSPPISECPFIRAEIQ